MESLKRKLEESNSEELERQVEALTQLCETLRAQLAAAERRAASAEEQIAHHASQLPAVGSGLADHVDEDSAAARAFVPSDAVSPAAEASAGAEVKTLPLDAMLDDDAELEALLGHAGRHADGTTGASKPHTPPDEPTGALIGSAEMAVSKRSDGAVLVQAVAEADFQSHGVHAIAHNFTGVPRDVVHQPSPHQGEQAASSAEPQQLPLKSEAAGMTSPRREVGLTSSSKSGSSHALERITVAPPLLPQTGLPSPPPRPGVSRPPRPGPGTKLEPLTAAGLVAGVNEMTRHLRTPDAGIRMGSQLSLSRQPGGLHASRHIG